MKILTLSRTFTRYLVAGVLQLAIDFVVFSTLLFFLPKAWLVNLISRLAGALAGFYLQRVAFEVRGSTKRQAGRFLILWCWSTAIGALSLQWIFTNYGAEQAIVAKLALEALLATMNFLFMRYWVFRKNRNS